MKDPNFGIPEPRKEANTKKNKTPSQGGPAFFFFCGYFSFLLDPCKKESWIVISHKPPSPSLHPFHPCKLDQTQSPPTTHHSPLTRRKRENNLHPAGRNSPICAYRKEKKAPYL